MTTKPAAPAVPQYASYECSACGTIHNAPAGLPFGLPVGWSAQAANAWCGACTVAGIPAREMRAAGKRHRRAA